MISRRVRAVIDAGAAYPLAAGVPDRQVVSLAANENPLGPPPSAVEAIAAAAAGCWQYPDQAPIALRGAIAEAVGLEPANVRLGNGSDELLDLICRAFLDPGDRVVIPTPTFAVYELAARLHGLEPAFVQASPPDFAWDPAALVDATEAAEAVIVCRPNNPTAVEVARDLLARLLDTEALVVVDEAYVDFTGDSVAGWVAEHENLVVTRSFSKLYGLAGVRIGYALANPDRVDTLGVVRAPYSVNRPAQAAALAALADGAFVEDVRGAIATERERVAGRLDAAGFTVLPSRVNFLTVSPTDRGMTGSALADALDRRDVLVRDLAGIRGLDEAWVRLTVGRPADNDRLLDAIEDIAGVST